jgi:hypothetical protein
MVLVHHFLLRMECNTRGYRPTQAPAALSGRSRYTGLKLASDGRVGSGFPYFKDPVFNPRVTLKPSVGIVQAGQIGDRIMVREQLGSDSESSLNASCTVLSDGMNLAPGTKLLYDPVVRTTTNPDRPALHTLYIEDHYIAGGLQGTLHSDMHSTVRYWQDAVVAGRALSQRVVVVLVLLAEVGTPTQDGF